jgi:phenylalanine-4-hydroxylase
VIAKIGNDYKMGNPIPTFDYSQKETKLWTHIWDKILPLFHKYACKEFNTNFKILTDNGIFRRERIP